MTVACMCEYLMFIYNHYFQCIVRQYVKNVSQKESYNVKDLITMEVKNLPHLTYFGVLQVNTQHVL